MLDGGPQLYLDGAGLQAVVKNTIMSYKKLSQELLQKSWPRHLYFR